MEKYKLKNSIYTNAYDKVLLCECLKTRKTMVMKMTNHANRRSNDLSRQVKLGLSLSDHHLIRMLDYFHHVEDNRNYLCLVLEYCEGGDLDKVIGNEEYDYLDIVTIMEEITMGLRYLHEKNIIHRDIKPENVLMSRGRAKLSDLGIARLLSNKNSGQMTGKIGTQFYLAPEMSIGNDYGLPIDIWSLGLLFIELIVGDRIDNLLEGQKPPHERHDFPTKKIIEQLHLPSIKKMIVNMLKRSPLQRINVHQILMMLKEIKQELIKSAKMEDETLELPLYIDTHMCAFKGVEPKWRYDEWSKQNPIHKTRVIAAVEDGVEIELQFEYDDYKEALKIVGCDYDITYSYAELPQNIRRNFCNIKRFVEAIDFEVYKDFEDNKKKKKKNKRKFEILSDGILRFKHQLHSEIDKTLLGDIGQKMQKQNPFVMEKAKRESPPKKISPKKQNTVEKVQTTDEVRKVTNKKSAAQKKKEVPVKEKPKVTPIEEEEIEIAANMRVQAQAQAQIQTQCTYNLQVIEEEDEIQEHSKAPPSSLVPFELIDMDLDEPFSEDIAKIKNVKKSTKELQQRILQIQKKNQQSQKLQLSLLYLLLGIIYYKYNSTDHSLNNLMIAQINLKELGSKGMKGCASAYHFVGMNYLKMRKFIKADNSFKNSLNLWQKLGVHYFGFAARAFCSLGNSCFWKGQYQMAIKYYDVTVEELGRNYDEEMLRLYSAPHHNRGECLRALNQRNEAMTYYQQALQTTMRFPDKSIIHTFISLCYMRCEGNDYQDAIIELEPVLIFLQSEGMSGYKLKLQLVNFLEKIFEPIFEKKVIMSKQFCQELLRISEQYLPQAENIIKACRRLQTPNTPKYPTKK